MMMVPQKRRGEDGMTSLLDQVFLFFCVYLCPPKPTSSHLRRLNISNGSFPEGDSPSTTKEAAARPAQPKAGGLDKKALLEKIAKQKEALLKRKQEQAAKLKTVQHEKDVKQLRQRLELERKKKEAERLQQIQSKLGTRAVIPNSAEGRTTLAINKRILAEKEREKSLFLDAAPELEVDPTKNKLFDPRVEVPAAARQRRSTFNFIEPGLGGREEGRRGEREGRKCREGSGGKVHKKGIEREKGDLCSSFVCFLIFFFFFFSFSFLFF